MEKTRLLFFLFLVAFIHGSATGQNTRFDLTEGIKVPNNDRYLIRYPTAGAASLNWSYEIETRITIPLIRPGIGPFIEGQYQPTHYPPLDEQTLTLLESSEYGVVAGMSSQHHLGLAEIELFGGIGYSWEDFNVHDPIFGSLTITRNKMIYVAGASIYFHFFHFLDATAAYRLTWEPSPNAIGSVEEGNYVFEGPSVLNTISIGFSVPLDNHTVK